jgi:hypothetical protein
MGKSLPFYYKWHAKKYRVQLTENKIIIITYLNINRMLIIYFKIYILKKPKISLKYAIIS